MVDVSDNFNRADGALGSNWGQSISLDPMTISGNKAVNVTGNISANFWSSNTFANDQHAQCSCELTVGIAGLVLRHGVASNCYLGWQDLNGNVTIYRVDAGTPANIAFAVGTVPSLGDILTFDVVGSLFTFRNVTKGNVTTATDATYASGQPGITTFSAGAALDNWSAGPLVVPGGGWHRTGIGLSLGF